MADTNNNLVTPIPAHPNSVETSAIPDCPQFTPGPNAIERAPMSERDDWGGDAPTIKPTDQT